MSTPPSTLSSLHLERECDPEVLCVTEFLSERPEQPLDAVALIILNSPIRAYWPDLANLWHHASFRLCADGGANRLHNLIQHYWCEEELERGLGQYLPDLIYGDLDSLDEHVRNTFIKLGVEVGCDADQYSTDFGKAVRRVVERVADVEDVIVLGSVGGRVDQGIGLLHELYREQTTRPQIRFWLFSEGGISAVLRRGKTKLHVPRDDRLIGENIGILPLFGPARISTEGLEWDVADWPTEMGGQVSTSNHIRNDLVTIETSHDVLFTVERAPGKPSYPPIRLREIHHILVDSPYPEYKRQGLDCVTVPPQLNVDNVGANRPTVVESDRLRRLENGNNAIKEALELIKKRIDVADRIDEALEQKNKDLGLEVKDLEQKLAAASSRPDPASAPRPNSTGAAAAAVDMEKLKTMIHKGIERAFEDIEV